MAINQYFDESKIIKKKPKEPTNEVIQEENKEETIQKNETNNTVEVKEISASENTIEMIEVQEDINQKAKEYVEKVKEFQEEKKEKPIYNISRDEQKNVVITPKKTKKEVVEVKDEKQEEENVNIFYEQYLKIKEENERKLQYTRVEIMIHNNLIKKEGNPDKRKTYESRLNIFLNDLELLNKRKSILEDDNLWQKV